MKILSKLFAVALVVALAVGFTSCKKECVECSLTGTDNVTYCEDDFGTKILYNAAVSAWELSGGTCTKK